MAELSAYHRRQYDEPYRSTIAFNRFLGDRLGDDLAGVDLVVDAACGAGAVTFHLASAHPEIPFLAFDYDAGLLAHARAQAQRFPDANVEFLEADWSSAAQRLRDEVAGKRVGILSVQTLSWIPYYTDCTEPLLATEPEFFAGSSLFDPLRYDVMVSVEDRGERISYYNVYSQPVFEQHFADHGYDVELTPFEIDIDLEQTDPTDVGSYTRTTDDGHRLTFSGPMHLPWHFFCARRRR